MNITFCSDVLHFQIAFVSVSLCSLTHPINIIISPKIKGAIKQMDHPAMNQASVIKPQYFKFKFHSIERDLNARYKLSMRIQRITSVSHPLAYHPQDPWSLFVLNLTLYLNQ